MFVKRKKKSSGKKVERKKSSYCSKYSNIALFIQVTVAVVHKAYNI